MGRQMPVRKKSSQPIRRDYVMNPNKGLNNLVADSLINKTEASDLLNISFEESGIIKKRDGFSSFGTTITDPQGLGYWYSESDKQLLSIDNGFPMKWYNNAWTTLAGGITLDATRPFIDTTQARSVTYMWDKVSGGVAYDGTTLTRPTTIPKAAFSIYVNGLHIASGVPGQPSRVYFAAGGKPSIFTRDGTSKPSGTNAGDGWPDNATDVPGATIFTGTAATFTIDVSKDDGYAVTGLGLFQGNIVIWKENAIYQLTFADVTADGTNATLTLITKSIGCIGHRTIAYVENDIYFLSRKGVYVLGNEANYYTVVRTNELSARVRPLIDGISPSQYELCNATYYRDKYLLAVPINSTTINRVLVYDRRYECWSVWDTIAPIDMMAFVDNAGIEHMYFVQDTEGTTAKEIILKSYNDDDKAISAYWESAALDGGSIDITKRWVDVGLVIRQLSGTLNVTITGDGAVLFATGSITANGTSSGYGFDMLGDGEIGGNIQTTQVTSYVPNEPYRFVVKRNSRTIKFRIENSVVNESFAVLGYILGYYPFGYYKFDSANKIY